MGMLGYVFRYGGEVYCWVPVGGAFTFNIKPIIAMLPSGLIKLLWEILCVKGKVPVLGGSG